MNLAQFLERYHTESIDFDGSFGCQCVDLFRLYNHEVLCYPHTGVCGTTGGAIDLWNDYDKMPIEKNFYKRLTDKPNAGDFAIWDKTSKNPYGHIALVLGETSDGLLVFEQDGTRPMSGSRFNIRPKKNLLGYLSPCQ